MAVRTSLSFAKLPDGDLVDFGHMIAMGIKANANFPTPPITWTVLEASTNLFTDKISAAKMGGKMDTAAKNAQRVVLLDQLRQDAIYVQVESGGDEAILLTSGYNMMSQNRASVPLDKPEEVDVSNGDTCELIARCKPVKNSSMYEIRAKDPAGVALESGFSGDSRAISVTELTPGVLYSVQVRALGGSTGHSPWSDPVSHRSM